MCTVLDMAKWLEDWNKASQKGGVQLSLWRGIRQSSIQTSHSIQAGTPDNIVIVHHIMYHAKVMYHTDGYAL